MKKPTISITLVITAALLGTVSPTYADEKDDIIARCRATMGEYGAAMVKSCADRDIEAEEALNEY